MEDGKVKQESNCQATCGESARRLFKMLGLSGLGIAQIPNYGVEN